MRRDYKKMLGSHGGDGGGKDPHRSWWKPSFGCKSSGSKKTGPPPPPRGAAKHLNLEAAFKKHGGPLPLYFDYKSKTWQSIGDTGSMYKSMLGSLIGNVPQYYDSWDDVPESVRDNILEEIQHWFAFEEYLDLPEDHPTRKAARGAFRADAASIYRQRKSRFKAAHFTARGGMDQLDTLQTAPPAGMAPDEWGRLLHFYTREDRVKRAATNKDNRSKQSVGTQGRRSISLTHDRALAKHANQRSDDPPPTWESTWASTHKLQPPEVRSLLDQAQERHSQDPTPTPPTQLFPEAFGSRSGHQRGLGRMLRGFGAQDFPYELPQPHYGHWEAPSSGAGSSSGPSAPTGYHVDLNQPGDIFFDPNQMGTPGEFDSLSDISEFFGGTGAGDDDAGSGD